VSKSVREKLRSKDTLPKGTKLHSGRRKNSKTNVSEQKQKESPKVPAQPKPEKIDVERAQEVIFQPNPGPQTEFLSAAEQEVLYGGAAGGGKSFAMVADPVRFMNNEDANMLLVRRTTEELRELISVSKKLFPKAIPGIKFMERDKTWVAPSGATLWMSYLDRDDDVTRYQGQAFNWIGFDELTQWPTPYAWNYMRSRLRTPKGSGLGLYQRATSDSGGAGHCVPFGEVLTSEGWVDIKEVKAGDKVISVDASGQQITKTVSDTVKEYYSGNMVSRKDEMVFTENHRLPIFKEDKNVEIRHFYELPGQCNVVRAAKPNRKGLKSFFEVPKYKTRKLRLPQPDKLSYADYAELMGWFLSEGHTLDRDKEFGISQTKEPQRTQIRELLDRCGFRYRESAFGFQVPSPKWWNYFRQFGKCRDKFIPRELLYSGWLSIFFDALMAGDGNWSGSGGTYYTTSKQLADDVLEVCILLGYSAKLKKRQRPYRRGLSYEVAFTQRNSTELVTGNHIYDVKTNNKKVNCNKNHFEGYVYCLTVEDTETFFIRQNGYVWLSGNTWVKNAFVDPQIPGKSFWAKDFETGETLTWPSNSEYAKRNNLVGKPMFKRRFIPATLFDNPYLSEDGMYEANLLSLPEHQRRQLLEGDWDINEGAAFPEFDRKIHVIEPFHIPENWPRFRAADYGYSSYSGVLWFAVSPSDQLFVYRELYVSKVLATDLADMVLEAEHGEKMRYGVLDSSLWHKRGDTGPSLAEQMNVKGCRWRPSDRSAGSRVAGKNELHRRLQVDDFTGEPRILFFNTCKNLIAQLPSLPLDKNNPEDVNTRSEDHLYDALRYGIMTRPRSGLFDMDASWNQNRHQPADNVFGY